MAAPYDVRVKLISLKAACTRGHKVGDEWIVKNNMTPGGMCISAFQVMIPNIRLLMAGGSVPWAPDPDTHIMCCPDPGKLAIFELKRLKK